MKLPRRAPSSYKCGVRRLLVFLLAPAVLLAAVGFLAFPDAGYSENLSSRGDSPKIEKRDTSNTNSVNDNGPIKIAHAVSLITCVKASRVKGFLDALIILRHSIHRNSVHAHPPPAATNGSAYSYQMFAFVHESGGCVQHVPLLKRLGYIPLVRATPVNVSAITTNDWYRDHVGGENCCGDAEFIKLCAYQLTDYPVVVHWDLDVAVLQPMDDLFDAMIFDKDSSRGAAARNRLQVQNKQQLLPDRIDAFITRDVTSAKPWEQVRAVQGGFVVARPNLEHFRLFQDFIMEANYTKGRGPSSGWGGMGYGGFQGAMAYQGVLAYFYDQIYPGHSVELDVCRWNQVVADVIYRGPERNEMVGQCRQYPVDGNFDTNTPENGKCEDCRVLPIDETRTVHFTACTKPWDCTVPHPWKPHHRNQDQAYRIRELTNVTTCRLLFRKYFDIRYEIESMIASSLGVFVDPSNATSGGGFEPEYFRGYCKGQRTYISMEQALPADFSMQQVYGF